MEYREEKRDLFTVPEDYYLAHCISADFALGRGIAVEFNRRFRTRRELQEHFPDFVQYYRKLKEGGCCIRTGHVLNLVTKEQYFQKPTLTTMKAALESMRDRCAREGIDKIAMPMIGSGLDKLDWEKVSELIREVFHDTDVEILVCRL